MSRTHQPDSVIRVVSANLEYQMHYRRAVFNASQQLMQQGRSLAEQRDYVGAYNAFRQAYAYDPVNQLALSEMERILRLQGEKDGTATGTGSTTGSNNANAPADSTQENQATPPSPSPAAAQRNGDIQEPATTSTPLRVIQYNNVDLKTVISSLAEQRLREEESQPWLDMASRWLDQHVKDMAERAEMGPIGMDLHTWLEAHVLRREAEGLVRAGPP